MNLFNKYASVHGEKKNLTFKIRILPIFLSLLLSLGAASPAFAAGNSSEKEEVIYINMYSDGSVKDVYAVNIFSGGNITDYGDYYSVELLNTSDKITQNGDLISFSSSADRVYCKGKMKRTVIPWNISIKYFIDGTEYSADEVAGKSGHLEIKFKVTRNESCSGPFFDNYALQAAFTLDTKKCRNITAPDATLANTGSKKQISYTMLPGKGIDTAITSDVTDFEMEAVSINGVPLSMNIEVEDYELTDRVTELIDAVSELDDGVSELLDGTSELKSGSDELQNGATELTGGASELLDGAQDLLDGASELHDGSAELDSGAQDILNGSAELKGGSAELCDGAQTLYETIRDVVVTAEKQLKSAMSDLVDGIKQIKNAFVDFVSGALYFKDSTEELYIGASEIDSGAQDLLDGATELKDGGNTLESGLNNANEGAS